MKEENDKEIILREQVHRINEASKRVRAEIMQLRKKNITEVDKEKKEKRRKIIEELESYSRVGSMVMEMYKAHKRGDITLEIKREKKIKIEIGDERRKL
jgi:hypothetical protein